MTKAPSKFNVRLLPLFYVGKEIMAILEIK
jgi:hypothetical protein